MKMMWLARFSLSAFFKVPSPEAPYECGAAGGRTAGGNWLFSLRHVAGSSSSRTSRAM